MRTKTLYGFFLLICTGLFLSSCNVVHHESDKPLYINVKLALDETKRESGPNYSLQDQPKTVLVLAQGVETVETEKGPQQKVVYYASNLMDQQSNTVSLYVPLETEMSLVKVVMLGVHELKDLDNINPQVLSYGKSTKFSVTAADEKKIISIPMINAPIIYFDIKNVDWLAYQNGAGAPWIRTNPRNFALIFQTNTDPRTKYGVAYHCFGTSTINVYQFTVLEINEGNFDDCIGLGEHNVAIEGTVSGLNSGSTARIAIDAYNFSGIAEGETFRHPYVIPGTKDILAVEVGDEIDVTGMKIPQNIKILRDQNVYQDILDFNLDFSDAIPLAKRTLEVVGDGFKSAWSFLLTRNETLTFSGRSVNNQGNWYPLSQGTVDGDRYRFWACDDPLGCEQSDEYDRLVVEVLSQVTDAGNMTFDLTQIAKMDGVSILDETLPPTFENISYVKSDQSPEMAGYQIGLRQDKLTWKVWLSKDWLGETTNYSLPDFQYLLDWQQEWSPASGRELRWSVMAVMSNKKHEELFDSTARTYDLPGLSLHGAAQRGKLFDETAPSLVQIRPFDGTTDVPMEAKMRVIFNEAMDKDSFAPDEDGSCAGNFQLSADDFSTCLAMEATPETTNNNKVVIFTPASELNPSTTYKIKVLTGATDLSGNALGQGRVQIDGFSTISEWIKTVLAGTALDDQIIDLAVDRFGNIYLAGSTYGEFSGYTNAGGLDIFVMKFSSSGELKWTHQLGYAANDVAIGVAVDRGGNLFVTGETYGDFGDHTVSGERDIFLLKYDTNGELKWTTFVATESVEGAFDVATDFEGSAYLTGRTEGSLEGFTNQGSSDLILVKVLSTGVVRWVQQVGSSSWDEGSAVSVDGDDFIYVVGMTEGDYEGNTNAGQQDAILTKFTNSGEKLWSRQIGTTAYDSGLNIAHDTENNTIISGITSGDLEGNTNAGGQDGFILKYDSDGTMLWSRLIGTAEDDQAYSVQADSLGNLCVAGATSGNLGGTNKGLTDGYVAQFSSDGDTLWTQQFGTDGSDFAFQCSINHKNEIFIGGTTTGNLDANTNQGEGDLFIMKFDSSGNKQ